MLIPSHIQERSSLLVCICLIFLFFLISFADAGPLAATHLRVERLVRPLGVDVQNPMFSWSLNHTERNQDQLGFVLLVSLSPDLKPLLWNTTVHTIFNHCEYEGPALTSDTTYYWTVYWWDIKRNFSAAAPVEYFGTGLFLQSDWKGQWISVANNSGNQLRSQFNLTANVVRGRAFASGLGYFELRINGQKVGDSHLDPAWTTTDKRVMYSTWDVTSLLQKGPNSVAAILGNGWWDVTSDAPWHITGAIPLFRLQMNLQLSNGQRVQVISNTNDWLGGSGAFLNNSIYDGETYDARRESDWDKPSWTPTRDWLSAVKANTSMVGVMSSQLLPPIKTIQLFPAKKITRPSRGVYIIDFEQNFSGWARLKLKGPIRSGTRIKIRFAEVLMHPPYGPVDGSIYTGNLRSAQQTDVYITAAIASGQVVEHEPRFTVHGFRYAELTGLPYEPEMDTLTGVNVRSAVDIIGNLSFANDVLNAIHHNIQWGQADNLMSVPTDCDQRDERKGWMGDAALTAEEASKNFDMRAFYVNFLQDIVDTQLDTGALADTTPYTFGGYPADPAWGTAFPTIAYTLFKEHGDIPAVERFYPTIKKYIEFVYKTYQSKGAADMIGKYGDWVPPPQVPGQGWGSAPPVELTSTFSLIRDLQHISEMAEYLGYQTDANKYRKAWFSVVQDFHTAFYNSTTKSYGTKGLQTAIVLAIMVDAIPPSVQSDVINTLIHDLKNRSNHLSTGIIGARWICEALVKIGREDLALQLLLNTDYPSWGYMIYNNLEPATTLWELWDSPFQGPSMNSRNHIMFGGVGDFFYTHLLGISQLDGEYNYEMINFNPVITTDPRFPSASGSIITTRGKVSFSWMRSTNPVAYNYTVSVPVGSVGAVHFSCEGECEDSLIQIVESGEGVWKNGRYIGGVPGVLGGMITDDGMSIMINVGSGNYFFSSANYPKDTKKHHNNSNKISIS